MGTSTLIVARTDAEAAKLLTSDIDERDQPFVDYKAGRTVEGFYQVRNGIEPLHRPRHRLCTELRPHLDGNRQAGSCPGAEVRRSRAQGPSRQDARLQLLALVQLEEEPRRRHDRKIPARARRHGLQVQFITLAGFHQLNFGMFELARGYKGPPDGRLFGAPGGRIRGRGQRLHPTKHQREVGTGYFDAVSMAISGGKSSTTAMHESTEHEQFRPAAE